MDSYCLILATVSSSSEILLFGKSPRALGCISAMIALARVELRWYMALGACILSARLLRDELPLVADVMNA